MQTLRTSDYLSDERDVNIHIAVVEDECEIHMHDFVEMIFILSGEGVHTVNGTSYDIGGGDLFILNANIPHSFRAKEGKPIVVYNCIFQEMFLDSAINHGTGGFVDVVYQYLFHSFRTEESPKEYIRLTGTNTKQIKLILDEICEEYTRCEAGYLQIIHAELTKLLVYVFRLYRQEGNSEKSGLALKRLIIENTLDYMRQHYQDNITCGQLAKRVYLSTSYFSAIFHEETGYSVIQMLQRIRVEEAVQLLKTTIYTVDTIADRVGYTDLKHFYKVFRKITGGTPGKYRNGNDSC